MNKKLSLVILGLALASVIVVALNGLSPEQREIFNECKKNCSTNKMLDMRACNDVSFECRNECRGDWKNLSQINRDTFNSCTAGCELNLSSNLTKQEKNNLIQECRRNCSAAKGIDRQESYADYRNCTRTCQDDKLNCKKAAIEDSLSCKQECTAIASNFTSGNVSIEKTHCRV